MSYYIDLEEILKRSSWRSDVEEKSPPLQQGLQVLQEEGTLGMGMGRGCEVRPFSSPHGALVRTLCAQTWEAS